MILGLAVAIAIFTYVGTYQIPDPIFTDFYAQDVWFGSDIPTVFGNITNIKSDFGRNNKHPLLPLLIFPLVFGIGKLLQLDPLSAVRVLTVIIAMLWIGSLYVLFRCMRCQRLDATLLSLVGSVSAASVFWLVITESFSFGSLTILVGLIFTVLSQTRPFSAVWYVLLNVVTVSITITNAMVGMFATFVNYRWRNWVQIIQIGVAALLLSTGLWILQRIVFTNSGFPFQPGTFIGEKKFVSTPGEGGFLAFVGSFFYQTMVMPTIQLMDYPNRPDWIKLEVNPLALGSGGFWGAIAVIAWSGLLILGLWSFFTIKQHNKLRVVLGLTLAAQLVMHSIYGAEETFIYSLHFIPLLLTLVAFSLLTRLRPFSLGLAVVLLISAGINNQAQFNAATTALWNYGTPRQQVEAQMKLRPEDPWLRSAGHVMLAAPGSSVGSKAFHEPGGSFSPNPGSFGVSLWVLDPQGNLIATSDSLPLGEIRQQFIEGVTQDIPGVATETPYYRAAWFLTEGGNWQLDLQAEANSEARLAVIFRSVGPAGGAVQSLNWNGNNLLINDRWSVRNIPPTANVYLGSEGTKDWIRQQQIPEQWEDSYGWGYARIELAQGEGLNLVLEDSQLESPPRARALNPISNLVLNLPDSSFIDSLNAQVAHLLMGLVGARTHPTDPISYPFPRFRDGAYQMVALARAGHLDVAQELAPYFAENDFFNGIVPEADIPALGIWALAEVATSLNQPDYDQWLWPHVRRKAELIMDMVSSHRPGYPVFEGASFPFSEHPDFMQVNLLAGQMENRPNGVGLDAGADEISYRALMDAVVLAARVDRSEDAERWRSQAARIKSAWQASNQEGISSLTKGLWPSGIAADDKALLTESLQQNWETTRNATGEFHQSPGVLQAAIAEAHQWLLLNQPDRVWPTLQWFWENQASPGLYTWSGNDGASGEMPMPGSFSQWHRFRGWINPSQTTPHYWTAAEMLLLQLDMLTYVDTSAGVPTLVIGAGIPPDWLTQPLGVKGQQVAGNLVNWDWDGEQMTVQVQGEITEIKLGAAFPASTSVNVERLPETTP